MISGYTNKIHFTSSGSLGCFESRISQYHNFHNCCSVQVCFWNIDDVTPQETAVLISLCITLNELLPWLFYGFKRKHVRAFYLSHCCVTVAHRRRQLSFSVLRSVCLTWVVPHTLISLVIPGSNLSCRGNPAAPSTYASSLVSPSSLLSVEELVNDCILFILLLL